MMKILAGLMIVLALLIGAIPQFTDCAAHGKQLTLADGRTVPMKCHWAGQAELATAMPLLATGSLLAASRRRSAMRAAGILGAVLGIAVILLPTALIGVCANPQMVCNAVMRPALILMGSLVTAASLVVVAKAQRMRETVE